jgi:hypothetical protein
LKNHILQNKHGQLTPNPTACLSLWVEGRNLYTSKDERQDWGCTSVVKCLTLLYKALASIPSTAKKKEAKDERQNRQIKTRRDEDKHKLTIRKFELEQLN